MARRAWMVFIVVLLMLSVLPVHAEDDGAAFALDCNGFTGTGGSLRLTRDNTRTSREAFVISATDGAGNVIYTPVEDTFFVGGTVSWVGIPQVRWTRTPQYNPLVLRVVSRAGNGFDERLMTLALGACDGLPEYQTTTVSELAYYVEDDTLVRGPNLAALPAGYTSPPVPLNSAPPRPTNPPELVEGQRAVMIVNTDNLSVRSGDGPQYTLLAVVDGGTRLIPLGRNRDFTWWYVQAGDIVGWVRTEFLILRGDATGLPVVPSRGEITQPRMFVHIEQPLYAVPAPGALSLCSLSRNQEYLIVGRDRGTAWYQIQGVCDGVLANGWIPAEFGSVRNPAGVFIPVTG